jgi:cobalt-zinc-cadmium efflux system outer membrane protein
MRLRLILIFAAGIIAPPALPVSAQSPAGGSGNAQYLDPVNGVTIEEAIAQALAREPSLRASRAAVDIARGAERQAALRANPSVSFERREEPGGTDNQTMASVEWPLELFRVGARKAVAGRERVVAELSVSDRERLLAAEVRQRYGELLVAVRELSVLAEMAASIEKQRDLLTARVGEGAAPALDRDLVEVDLLRWQADRLLQIGRADAALVRLKRVMGLSPEDPLKVRYTLESVVVSQAILQPASGAARRADVRAAEARVALADAEIDRVRRNGRFDVSLFGSYSRMDAGFMQRGFGSGGTLERVRGVFNYVAAGVMVMVPLFDRNEGEIASAQAARSGAEAAYRAAALDASSEVAAARALDDRAHEGLRIFSEDARTRALRNLDVIRESYALGRATVFDVLAEQRRYLDFERAYTGALASAYEARAALLTAQGAL